MKKMGRDRKLVEAQIEGLCRAYTIVKKENEAGGDGLKKLEEEIKFRNITYTPLSYSADLIMEYLEHMSENILTSTLLLALTVLRDEFGFGESRAKRFWQRYTLKTECLRDSVLTELSWEDLANQAKEELGFDITLDWEAWRRLDFMEDEKNGYKRNNSERN